jgi:hypothetical protein
MDVLRKGESPKMVHSGRERTILHLAVYEIDQLNIHL